MVHTAAQGMQNQQQHCLASFSSTCMESLSPRLYILWYYLSQNSRVKSCLGWVCIAVPITHTHTLFTSAQHTMSSHGLGVLCSNLHDSACPTELWVLAPASILALQCSFTQHTQECGGFWVSKLLQYLARRSRNCFRMKVEPVMLLSRTLFSIRKNDCWAVSQ